MPSQERSNLPSIPLRYNYWNTNIPLELTAKGWEPLPVSSMHVLARTTLSQQGKHVIIESRDIDGKQSTLAFPKDQVSLQYRRSEEDLRLLIQENKIINIESAKKVTAGVIMQRNLGESGWLPISSSKKNNQNVNGQGIVKYDYPNVLITDSRNAKEYTVPLKPLGEMTQVRAHQDSWLTYRDRIIHGMADYQITANEKGVHLSLDTSEQEKRSLTMAKEKLSKTIESSADNSSIMMFNHRAGIWQDVSVTRGKNRDFAVQGTTSLSLKKKCVILSTPRKDQCDYSDIYCFPTDQIVKPELRQSDQGVRVTVENNRVTDAELGNPLKKDMIMQRALPSSARDDGDNLWMPCRAKDLIVVGNRVQSQNEHHIIRDRLNAPEFEYAVPHSLAQKGSQESPQDQELPWQLSIKNGQPVAFEHAKFKSEHFVEEGRRDVNLQWWESKNFRLNRCFQEVAHI